jgi:hypothetical protein
MGAAMTEEKKQAGRTSGRKMPAPGEGSYRVLRELEKGSSPMRGTRQQHPPLQSLKRRRNVVMPESVQASSAWDRYTERRDSFHSARAQARAREAGETKLVARTLAQTGSHAPAGQIRKMPRSLPGSYSLPVPRRSSSASNRARRSKQRGGILWKALGLFGIGVIVVLGASFALTSPAFRVEQVNVSGTHNQALEEQIQSMGMQGQNIFMINVAALTARIDGIPMVASASLQKQWPNQLQVTVTVRAPVLLWQTSNGIYGVDREGFVVAPAGELAGTGQLMTVKDMRTYKHVSNGEKGAALSIQPGQRLNAADIAFATSVFATLPRLTGLKNFTLLYDKGGEMEGNSSFVVASQAGWQAYLGGPGDSNPLSNRLIELQGILAMAQQQQLKLATIDLRFGLRPVYTVKS